MLRHVWAVWDEKGVPFSVHDGGGEKKIRTMSGTCSAATSERHFDWRIRGVMTGKVRTGQSTRVKENLIHLGQIEIAENIARAFMQDR